MIKVVVKRKGKEGSKRMRRLRRKRRKMRARRFVFPSSHYAVEA